MIGVSGSTSSRASIVWSERSGGLLSPQTMTSGFFSEANETPSVPNPASPAKPNCD